MFGTMNGDMANEFNDSCLEAEWENEFGDCFWEGENFKSKPIKLNIMTKSKVEKIVEVKPWTGTNGIVLYHTLEMDNGDKINIGKKKELAIGEEITYEITDSGHEYNKAKTVMENPSFGGKGKSDDYVKGIEVGHAINNAVNLICAGAELDIKECKSTEEKIYESAKVIMAIANRLKSE